jgi:hypothetical protein
MDHETTSLKGKLEKTAVLGKKGVFGTTNNRFYGSDLHEGFKTAHLPGLSTAFYCTSLLRLILLYRLVCSWMFKGPGQYEVQVIPKNKKEVRSVFQSKTLRFKDTSTPSSNVEQSIDTDSTGERSGKIEQNLEGENLDKYGKKCSSNQNGNEVGQYF